MDSIKSRFDILLELVDRVVTRIDGMHSEAKEFGITKKEDLHELLGVVSLTDIKKDELDGALEMIRSVEPKKYKKPE